MEAKKPRGRKPKAVVDVETSGLTTEALVTAINNAPTPSPTYPTIKIDFNRKPRFLKKEIEEASYAEFLLKDCKRIKTPVQVNVIVDAIETGETILNHESVLFVDLFRKDPNPNMYTDEYKLTLETNLFTEQQADVLYINTANHKTIIAYEF